MDEDVEGPVRGELGDDTLGGHVPSDERRLGARRAQLLRRLLGRAIVAEVPHRHPCRTVPREAERDRLADPAGAAGDEHRPPGGRHSLGSSGS